MVVYKVYNLSPVTNPSFHMLIRGRSRWWTPQHSSAVIMENAVDVSSTAAEDHLAYMRCALALAKMAPPKPTNFCVGAVLVNVTTNRVLSTGYTMELPGNTHAEQCCLEKLGDDGLRHGDTPCKLALYTTMEPCNQRTSGNIPCTETILRSKADNNVEINIVYVGVQEPETFVGENLGRARLEGAGIEYVHVPGLEEQILAVATAGHNGGPP